MEISSRLSQLENKLSFIVVTPNGIWINNNFSHEQNASDPMKVTLEGIVIDFKFLQ